ncbi:hypothetical protein PIROE2DRAFT_5561 [Piromyces sp. E2]|nr:hypothetical protein PIROE2DRAFT_5561 [Piromyces sp. E2]|eukprot:OUM67073.1 hypothetical protein PIROE2DRAFT_5561 [Piromyces sp. E2]
MTNINRLNMKIISTIFEKNYASYGGSIYLKQLGNNHYRNNILILNSKFIKNQAKYFGGAIYSDSVYFNSLNLTEGKNVSFTENHAYSGGALYFNNIDNVDSFLIKESLDKLSYNNNTSESHGNKYATNPYSINTVSYNSKEIIIKSGELFPLEFILVDKFNQTVYDISKYYSNVMLTIYDEDITKNENDIKIEGNTCNFTKGKCELQNFKIYSKNLTTLNLNLILEYENKLINVNNIPIKLIIDDCSNDQIKLFMKNSEYYYCENPKCNDNCPKDKAVCVKSKINNININDKNINICSCLAGWKGYNCELKDYLHINLAFNSYINYSNCVIHFIMKHCGILLIYIMFLIYTSSGLRLGMDYKKLGRLNLNAFQNDKVLTINNKHEETTFSETLLKKIEEELNNVEKSSISEPSNIKKYNSKSSINKQKEDDQKNILKLNKNKRKSRL